MLRPVLIHAPLITLPIRFAQRAFEQFATSVARQLVDEDDRPRPFVASHFVAYPFDEHDLIERAAVAFDKTENVRPGDVPFAP